MAISGLRVEAMSTAVSSGGNFPNSLAVVDQAIPVCFSNSSSLKTVRLSICWVSVFRLSSLKAYTCWVDSCLGLIETVIPASLAQVWKTCLNVLRCAAAIFRHSKKSSDHANISFTAVSGLVTAANFTSSIVGRFNPNSSATFVQACSCNPFTSRITPSSLKIAPNSLNGLLIRGKYCETPVE